MMRFGLTLEGLPRLNPFWLPLKAIGYSPEKTAEPVGVRHAGFNIGLTLKGQGGAIVLAVDGVRHAIKIPCFHFSMPGAVYQHLTPLPSELFYLCYDRKYLDRLLAMGLEQCLPGFTVASPGRVTGLVNQIFGVVDNIHDRGNVDRLDRLCEQLINEMLLSRTEARTRVSQKERNVRRAASHLELHYMDKIDLVRLAAENGFTLRTFLRQWGRIFPMPPVKFINNLRMREAARLLVETELPVAEIARKVGMEDALYFSKAFRKFNGQSPSACREARSERKSGGRDRRGNSMSAAK